MVRHVSLFILWNQRGKVPNLITVPARAPGCLDFALTKCWNGVNNREATYLLSSYA